MKPVIVGRLIAAAGCLLVALACQTEAAPVPDVSYATRDSADILIAENTGFPSPEDSWVVEADPFLSIGGVSAAPLRPSSPSLRRPPGSATAALSSSRTRHPNCVSSTRRAGTCGPRGAEARDRANSSTPRPSRV